MSSSLASICLSFATCTFLGAAPALWGQETGGRAPAPASIGRGSVGVRAFPDRLAGGGPDYRLELRSSGVRFVPALGSRAEHALPVEFALESVTVGGVALPVAAAGVEPEAEGSSLLYRRGAGVTERYDLRTDGVEQSFVLESLPPQRGEVVVRGRLTSELPLASADERTGLAFALPDLGGVRIGGVTGVDATGRSAPGRVLLSGDQLELRLDADFVEQAALPLTLDPLITALILINDAQPDDSEPDVAYDEEGDYLAVWTRRFASGDTEIRGQRMALDGSPEGGLLLISSSGGNTEAAVGSLDSAHLFIVAWVHGGLTANSDVLFCSVSATGAISPELPAGATLNKERQPDVGSGHASCPVVWREDNTGILSAQIILDSFGDAVVNHIAEVSDEPSDHSPAVATANDGLSSLVVWSSGSAVNDVMHGVRWIGFGPSGDTFTITTTLEAHGAPACAAADSDDYMIVWSQAEPGLVTSHDVYGARVLFPGSGAQVLPPFAIEAGIGDDERSPVIAYAKHAYVVAFLDENQGGQDDVFAKAIDSMTGEILEELALNTNGDFSPPAIAGPAVIGDFDAEDDVLAVYTEEVASDGDVLAALIDGVGGTQDELTLTGCFSAGDPRASAARSPNPKHRHELWDAEPGAPCILAVGWGEQQIDVGGGTIVPALDQMLAVFPGVADANGFIGTKVPIPEGLAGSTFWFQWATIPSAAACTTLGIDLSNAIEIVVE